MRYYYCIPGKIIPLSIKQQQETNGEESEYVFGEEYLSMIIDGKLKFEEHMSPTKLKKVNSCIRITKIMLTNEN